MSRVEQVIVEVEAVVQNQAKFTTQIRVNTNTQSEKE